MADIVASTQTKERRLPRFIPGLIDPRGEQCRQYFLYESEAGLVTGTVTHVSLDLPYLPDQIWPTFKDFNIWQNCRNHFYSHAVGDLETGVFRLSVGTPADPSPVLFADYRIERVIPPHIVAFSQIVASTGPIAGMGGYSSFLLTPRSSYTRISILMQHDRTTKGSSEEEALDFWRSSAPENLKKWGEYFLPTLRDRIARSRNLTDEATSAG